MTPNREPDGRFASRPLPAPMSLVDALALYNRYLETVCRHQGLALGDVQRQLSRTINEASHGGGRTTARGGPSIQVDRDWLRAVYARQLAVYLANTVHNVPQALLAQIIGQSRSAVCQALREVEHLRDHRSYEALIENITIEAKAANAAGAQWA